MKGKESFLASRKKGGLPRPSFPPLLLYIIQNMLRTWWIGGMHVHRQWRMLCEWLNIAKPFSSDFCSCKSSTFSACQNRHCGNIQRNVKCNNCYLKTAFVTRRERKHSEIKLVPIIHKDSFRALRRTHTATFREITL